MILLTSTGDLLRIITSAAVTVDVHASYVDMSGSTITPGRTNTAISTATTTTVVSSPAASTQRTVKTLLVRNTGGASVEVTIVHTDGTTAVNVAKATLAAGTSLHYDEGNGFVRVDAAGVISTSNSIIGRHSIPVSAGSMRPSVTGGCSAHTAIASAANQPDIVTLDFDPTTQEYAQFSIDLPNKWDRGVIYFLVKWSHAATTTNFGVAWDLQGVAVGNGEAIAAAFGTAQAVTDTGGTTDYLYTSPESAAITIAGSPAAGDKVFCRFSRVTGNGGDNMTIDARLHSIEIYVGINAETDA